MAVIVSKALIIFLFISIFSLKLISAQLKCWKCDPCPEPHDNSSSLVSAVTCTSSQTICVKNRVATFGGSPQISKGCVSSCTASSSMSLGSGVIVACCNTDYCNLSAKNQLSPIISILFMPLYWLMRLLS